VCGGPWKCELFSCMLRTMVAVPADFVPAVSNRCMYLTDMEKGQAMRVAAVTAAAGVPQDTLRRLTELGFLPGERVRIIARGALGGEPIAVRVGTATFALRLAEAQCIQVTSAIEG
jgi:ferrous iron transport protein A